MNSQKLNYEQLKSLLPIKDKHYENYVLAIESIDKHVRYCEYHHNQSIPLFKNISLTDKNGFDNRIKIQAHALAHLQSLHALVDSIPYTVLLLNKNKVNDAEKSNKIDPHKKLRRNNVSLCENSIKVFSLAGLDVTILKKALNSQICEDLRKYINQTKHRYIDKFTNQGNETFIYIPESKPKPLKEYLTETHNHIVFEIALPFYRSLYNSKP